VAAKNWRAPFRPSLNCHAPRMRGIQYSPAFRRLRATPSISTGYWIIRFRGWWQLR